jgi:DNA-binding response OmpR family regulator
MANLLIIDDDNDILRLLEFTFTRAGHRVATSADGVQGLAKAEAQKPDLIICDVMMPRMTGYEFCRQARTKTGLQKTPIIVYSARFQPIDKQTALEAGATDYLPKSTSPDELLHRVDALLPMVTAVVAQGMIGMFSLKGGVGVTCLAVNLAVALTLTHKTQVALVDLALLGGHSALMLGLRPNRNLFQLLSSARDNLSMASMQPYLIQHPSGLQLLTSPPAVEQTLALNSDRLLQLMKGLKSNFAMSILDFPSLLEPHLSAILQYFDKIILVLSPDMPSMQSAAIALQGLVKLGVANNKIALAVNQVTPHHALPIETIQKVLKRQVSASIPYEPEMAKAVNSGQPLFVSSPQSPAALAISRLAGAIFSS